MHLSADYIVSTPSVKYINILEDPLAAADKCFAIRDPILLQDFGRIVSFRNFLDFWNGSLIHMTYFASFPQVYRSALRPLTERHSSLIKLFQAPTSRFRSLWCSSLGASPTACCFTTPSATTATETTSHWRWRTSSSSSVTTADQVGINQLATWICTGYVSTA